ncbi:hypothetical protein BaRGS_00005609 [Batillaria attramentaria]|uniref:Ketoreductase domain-containing protein n=1 Tax=Batillaria attramentaria TaxID=370345 RepID=A0ABD0LV42_9CAEN
MASLLNKVVLITGASTGIGACTAKFMAKYKPKLVLVARSPNKLQAVQKNCIEAGCAEDSVVTITADLGKHEDLGRVVSGAVSAFGQLDVLVNNAFAGIISNVEHTSPDAYDRCMAVNIRAPFFLSQAAMTHLKKTEGSIVNISSISAQMVDNNLAAYSISKAALEHFTRIMAYELAPSNVRVNALTVGVTTTDTLLEFARLMGLGPSTPDGTDTRNEAMLKSQPLGGACSMEDIAKMVTLLTSDLASAITGTCIPVDRGALLAASHQDAVGDFHNMGDYNSVPTEVKMKQLSEAFAKRGGGMPKAKDGK